MNLIDKQLIKIKNENRIGLMTHMVVGFPSLDKTISLVKNMAEAGVDFVELQIPFSEPLADGPTIMGACEKALRDGVKVKDAFDVAAILSKDLEIPLLFMSYYNIVFKYGTEKFCADAKKAGISGLIVPDIPFEEEKHEHFNKFCKREGLKNIRVISPSSTAERLRLNSKSAEGFIYCTARQGITGSSKELDPNLKIYLTNVRKYFKIPIAVGFGISNKERLSQVKPFADIAVIGSAVIDIINNSQNIDLESNLSSFLKSILDGR